VANEIVLSEQKMMISPSQEKALEIIWPQKELNRDHRKIGMMLANRYRLDPFAGHINLWMDTRGRLVVKPSREGWMAIAKDSGYSLSAEVVRSGDIFEYDASTQTLIKHKFGPTRGDIKGAWGCLEKDGHKTYAWAEFEEYRKEGKRKDGSSFDTPWDTYRSVMIKGKALELVCKLKVNISGFLSAATSDGEIPIAIAPEVSYLTREQQGKIFAVAKEKSIDVERMKLYLYDKYKVESTMDLAPEQAGDLIEFLEFGDIDFLKKEMALPEAQSTPEVKDKQSSSEEEDAFARFEQPEVKEARV
jgi:RecT family